MVSRFSLIVNDVTSTMILLGQPRTSNGRILVRQGWKQTRDIGRIVVPNQKLRTHLKGEIRTLRPSSIIDKRTDGRTCHNRVSQTTTVAAVTEEYIEDGRPHIL